ncbi:MAG: hypothetical protein ACERKV_13475 [Clostridiaceae bacterium]
MKKKLSISIFLIIIAISFMGCVPKEKVDEALNSSTQVKVSDEIRQQAKKEGVSVKEMQNTLDGLIKIGAEKYGVSEDDYVKQIEANGNTVLSEWQAASKQMGISITELYEYEKQSANNMSETSEETLDTSADNTDGSLDSIKKELSNEPYDSAFIAYIDGTSKDEDGTVKLKYDVYYRNADVKIDTYYNNRIVSNSIFNDTSFKTYTVMTMGTQYAEILDGNWLPLRFLNIETFEMMENDSEVKSFEWQYEKLDNEDVIYTKTVMEDDVKTEQWYSITYSIPVKFHQEWIEEGSLIEIDWKVSEIHESDTLDDSIFEIPDDAEVTS